MKAHPENRRLPAFFHPDSRAGESSKASRVARWILPLVLLLAPASAQTADTLVFGNATSEAAHSFQAYFPPPTDVTTVAWDNTPPPSEPSVSAPSDVIAGGMGLSARRLLPRTPNGDIYGGQITFTMKVDPVKQNYFTVKFWGSDPANDYLVLNVNGKEIGNRHGGGGLNEDPFYFNGTGWYPNRFFYRTAPLPLVATRGRTTATITIRSEGSIYYYAPVHTYVPQYQHILKNASLPMYSAYTHVGSLPDVTGEVQGTEPPVLSPRTSETEAATLATIQSNVNGQTASRLNAAGSSLDQWAATHLSRCYDAKTNYGASWIVYPAGKTDADLGNQVIAALDTLVGEYALDATVAAGGWGGNLGDMGEAVRLVWPLISGSMSATVAYGGTVGTVTRQAAWAQALRASVDFGRYNRRTIANQDLACAWNVYRANRAILLVDSTKALLESEAVRYLKEASGTLPWFGNDQATGGTDGLGGGPVPTRGTAPYGPNWFMGTSKGTTKDGDGFVGSDYGDLASWIYRMGLLSGDTALLDRGLVMTRARCQFRYPGTDDDGYRVMMGTNAIGVRGNGLPSHHAYLGRGFTDEFWLAREGAATVGADLIGYFQQAVNDGQLWRAVDKSDPYIPGFWATIKAMPQTNVKLPTTSGTPDYAWVDEENMVVAARHGEDRFYANLYWRQPNFINGLAKVFRLTPTTAQLADVMIDDVRFRSTGATFMTSDAVGSNPPDKPVNAFGSLPMSVAWRDDLSAVPAGNRDGGRGTGYTLRYGNWLVGINASYNQTYTVALPSNFTTATDLISGQVKSGPVTLAPKTSVVFYLPTTVDPNPPPARSLYIKAAAGNGAVALGWADTAAAVTYNVLRSTTSGGSYATIATGIATARYQDTAVINGTTYHYVVQAVNAAGVTGGNSPEASATPAAPATAGLPVPWKNLDFGTSTGGLASVSGGTFTVKSGPGDIWNTTDGCHFAYQPFYGDGIFTARIDSRTSANTNAKAGLMIRSTTDANSIRANICLLSSGRAELGWRGGTGSGSSNQSLTGATTFTLPCWVRLVRGGTTVTGYVSQNGSIWNKVGSTNLGGLAYASHVGLTSAPASTSGGQTNTATFSQVSLPQGATAAPATPSGLTAVTGLPGSVVLGWTAPAGATGVTVKRGTSASGPYLTVASGLTAETFTDHGLAAGITYHYLVTGTNSFSESAPSASVSVQTGAAAPAALTGLAATPGETQVTLTWNASAGATGYTITRSTAGGQAAVIASGLGATTYTDTGLANGTLYHYGVSAVNAAGQGQGAQIAVLPPGGLPAPWLTRDIGNPQPGGAGHSGGVLTLAGSGYDIWGTSDQFRYAYQSATGDCMITARVLSLTNTAGWNKVGVMIRDTPAADSAYYAVEVTSGNGVSAQARLTAGTGAGTVATTGGLAAPYWVRVVRVGSNFTGYRSADGITWTGMGSRTIPMGSTAYVGLIVCSTNASAVNTATFDNVTTQLSLATGGAATANSGTTGQQAAQAFDGNTGTKWYSGVNGGTGWIAYQLPVARAVNHYQVTSANDVPLRDPKDWQFQGSDDGINWTTLDTRTGQTFANRFQAIGFPVENTTAYLRYRLNITANNGGSGYPIQLSELSFSAPNPGDAPLAPEAPAGLSAVWGTGQIALSWPASFGATSYNLKVSTTPGGPYTPVATGLTGTSHIHTGLANGTAYYYVVTAVNAGQESSPSVENSATPVAPPAVPAGLAGTPGQAQVALSWSLATGATRYAVKRATSGGGPYDTVGLTTSTGYTDTGLANGTTYHYVVSAVNLAAESADSASASAVPGLPPITDAELASPPITIAGGTASLTLATTVPGRTYRLQRSYTLGTWENIGPVQNGGGALDFSDTPSPPDGKAFYRILIGP